MQEWFLPNAHANINGDSTKAVGSYRPNVFGLYDMHGNVCEWCEDWYGDYPAGAVTDPKGPATGEYRVLRGGSFNSGVWKARSSRRVGYSPTNHLNYLGFRLARTLDSNEDEDLDEVLVYVPYESIRGRRKRES